MQDLTVLETAVLLDMLAKHTATYTKMLAENYKGEDFKSFQGNIKLIQQEIQSRQTVMNKENVPDANVSVG